MAYQDIEPVIRVFIFVGLTIVGFMACGLALSFYRNALFEQTLEKMRERNIELATEISTKERDLLYYKSSQYKDKYAKENLGMVNPGEQVIILTDEIVNSINNDAQSNLQIQQKEVQYIEQLKEMPIIEHWKIYFFYPEEARRLKQGLR